MRKMHVGASAGLQNIDSFIHSDTLYSAICTVWLRLYGTEDMVQSLLPTSGRPKLSVSSCFPFYDGTYFFPKIATYVEVPLDVRKKYKKMRFLPQSIFETIISGKESTDIIYNYLSGTLSTHGTDDTFSSVALDRTNSASELYEITDFWIHENAGLFFLYSCDEDIESKFHNVLNVLGDEGIGGKRSSGRGTFVPELTDIELALPDNPTMFTTLSLYYPTSGESLSPEDNYSIVERGGWVSSHIPTSIKRKRVAMFTEGSLFASAPKGEIVDVTPDGHPHPVFRNGRAFAIPVIINEH